MSVKVHKIKGKKFNKNLTLQIQVFILILTFYQRKHLKGLISVKIFSEQMNQTLEKQKYQNLSFCAFHLFLPECDS